MILLARVSYARLDHWADHVNWDSVALVATGVGTLGLAAAALWALKGLSESKRDRHAQMIIELGNRWDSQLLVRARRDAARYEKKLAVMAAVPTRSPVGQQFLALLRVPNYFEDLAMLMKDGSLDAKLVGRGFKALIVDEWETWEPAIRVMQEQDRYAYSQFEWLLREMEKLPDE